MVTSIGKNAEKSEPLHPADRNGMSNGAVTVENNLEVPQKV